jgi:hypothetical protein
LDGVNLPAVGWSPAKLQSRFAEKRNVTDGEVWGTLEVYDADGKLVCAAVEKTKSVASDLKSQI